MEKLHSSGEIFNYTWLWEESKKCWSPIDPPPTRAPKAPESPKNQESQKPVEVICHNRFSLVSGLMRDWTESGCEIVSSQEGSAPPFAQHSSLTVNVLEDSGRSSRNIIGRLSNSYREGAHWVYRIRFAHP